MDFLNKYILILNYSSYINTEMQLMWMNKWYNFLYIKKKKSIKQVGCSLGKFAAHFLK